MKRRHVILALAAVLVLAVAIPAVGQSGSASVTQQLSTAAQDAATALESSDKAQQANRKTRKQLKNLKTKTTIGSDVQPGLVTSASPLGSYESKGGPSVTVTVPKSGLIEVWAQADIADDEGGAVALFEDGQVVSGGTEPTFCGRADMLFVFFNIGGPGDFQTYSTPGTLNFLGCTSTGAASPVILQRTPGKHTYELRYSDCGCGGTGKFRNRVLRVGPRL